MIRCALSSDPFWCLWGLLPWWAQWGIVGCILLILAGAAFRLYSLAKTFGGWPAAVGALGILGIVAAVLWPKKGKPVETDEIFPYPDQPKPRKKRQTIFDGIRK